MSGYCHVLSRLLKGLSSCFPHFYPCLPRVCNSQYTNCISLRLQLKQMITTLVAWNENYLYYSCHGSDIQAQYGSVGSIYGTERYQQGCDLEALGKICFWSFRLLTEFSSIRGRPDVLIFLLAFGEVWFSAARSFLHSLVHNPLPTSSKSAAVGGTLLMPWISSALLFCSILLTNSRWRNFSVLRSQVIGLDLCR